MVLARQHLLTGKPLYKGASSRPTAGTVKPQGYLQREIKKRGIVQKGRDGQSDSRSGLAAGMLQAGMQQANPYPTIDQTKIPDPMKSRTSIVKGVTGANVTADGQAGPYQSPASTIPTGGPPAPYTAPVSNPVYQPQEEATPVNPVITVNPVGQLQLPWDDASNYEAVQQQQQMQQAMLEMQMQQQQDQAQWQVALEDAEKQYKTQKRGRLNDNASRGTAFSSMYGTGVNQDSEDYNTGKNKLLTERTNSNNRFNLGISGIKNQFSNYLQNLAYQKALLAAQNAAALASQQAAAAARAPKPIGGAANPSGDAMQGILQGGPANQQWKPTQQQQNKLKKFKGHGWGM